ncbi:hypothetical protein, conserved [Trypanosoma brucei gambiense DAL972]|uniref:Uncharacterized protein n=2 Tax=Trypanosoma brucei TaxID=5691 RepID=C9ZKJ7_TRYB9|nr:hypothetical protein, conserved [Trypanosoma brucei gambiense DAL972]RHW73907.1 hypothetical protein DPX39_030028500 [Trypanosoma brucei equiperdum]CBH09963.1 hypothetical protein, conserved [Trypanosoma brucei gambiense DAL972]|eukprot:XP_011772254.1 hypothetical protein, conserved [Trypanosoma brucei gambiense DAL972]
MPRTLFKLSNDDYEAQVDCRPVRRRRRGSSGFEESAADFTIRSPNIIRWSGNIALIGKTLFTLWGRLLDSYRRPLGSEGTSAAAAPDGTLPFVVDTNDGRVAKRKLTSTQIPDDGIWQSTFGKGASLEVMFTYLYDAVENLDSAAWLIAFGIIDKLHLQYALHTHRGRERISDSVAAYHSGDVAPAATAIANNSNINDNVISNYPSFRFFLGNTWRNLFVAYGLALKWHADAAVTFEYLVTLLPYASTQMQRYLCKTTARVEREMLRALDFNVAVELRNVRELLDVFLTSVERMCLSAAIEK